MTLTKRIARRRIYDTHYDTKKIFVPLHTNFVLRNYIRKDGTAQIYLHVFSDGERKRIALDLYIEPKKWIKRKQQAKPSEVDFNLIIDNLKASITEIKTQYRLSNQALTIEKFLKEFQSDFSRIDFLAFWLVQLEIEKHSISQGAYRRYKAVHTKLKRCRSKILFSEITYGLLQRIRSDFKQLGNKDNTIEANFSVIRKFLNLAKRQGIKFPLDLKDLKVKPQIANRVSLKPEQIEKLYLYFNSEFIPPQRKLILGYFLFSCFTGVRIGDIQKMKRQEIKNSFQIIVNKTQRRLTINLTQKAQNILKAEPLLFEKFYSAKHINEELKEIASATGIKENVTFHIARHSFATNYLRMGGNVVYLSKLLGHSDIKTTMIYESITEEEKNKDINLLDNMF